MINVSVIIPTYNRSDFLEVAVRSVLAQTYRNFEIIIIDDASADNTKEMIENSFVDEIKLGRIRYLKNVQHTERSISRNRGMLLAVGEYIALLDDDDLWLPEHLKGLVNFLDNNPQVAVVFSNIVNYSFNGVIEKVRSDNPPTGFGRYYRELCIMGHLVSSQASLFRKKIIDKIGGMRSDLVYAEDWEFFSRIAMSCEVGYVNQLTCLRRIHTGMYRMPPDETIASVEKTLLIIKNNTIKYNYPISNSILAKKYLDIGKSFIPYNFSKLRMYILKALKTDFKVILHYNTYKLLIRAILGKNIYLVLQRIAIWRHK